jgi:CubicO group peptidase (beta-lactamase class C family)
MTQTRVLFTRLTEPRAYPKLTLYWVMRTILQHLETHQIPALAWAFGRVGELETGFCGKRWHTPDAPDTTLHTVFDLASLTKVMVTVPLLLKLIDAGKLDPNAPLLEMLPQTKGLPLETATVLQLVSHTAGLEALSPLRTWKLPRAAALQKSLEAQRPKTGILYSDQSFIVLTHLLETLYGAKIDAIAERELFAPLEVDLTYAPNPQTCAATELDASGNLIIGRVHDENTAALEGVSGHAGLFGSLPNVVRYLESLMAGKILSPAMLALMNRPIVQGVLDARAFGWLIPHPDWLGGNNSPPDTLGHTGFTGTGVWFSLETRQLHVLLTNRVCPSRDTPNDIAGLRRAFNAATWK